MKTLEQQKREYGVFWDRYAPGLYRFGCFLTGSQEQAALCLEQVFLDGWKKHRQKGLSHLWLYRDLWVRWRGLSPCSGEQNAYQQVSAMLYLIHIQHFSSRQAAYVVREGGLFAFGGFH